MTFAATAGAAAGAAATAAGAATTAAGAGAGASRWPPFIILWLKKETWHDLEETWQPRLGLRLQRLGQVDVCSLRTAKPKPACLELWQGEDPSPRTAENEHLGFETLN